MKLHFQNCRRPGSAFTLLELLTAMAVLALLLIVIAKLLDSTAKVAVMGDKKVDADAQARSLLDRMAFDFSKMVKRKDVDYFLKQPGNTQTGNGQKAVNDQIAFFCELAGYYPSGNSTMQSTVSLAGYRVGADAASPALNRMQRLGKGLLWNGASSTDAPLVVLPLTIGGIWPAATSASATDPDYEMVGPHVFRFEYFYLLKGQTPAGAQALAPVPSDKPWDSRISGHVSADGLRDVAAIAVVIGVIDPKSRALISETQLADLIGNMPDYSNFLAAGDLVAKWQAAVDSSQIPRAAAAGIRIYQRTFFLDSPSR